MNLSKKVSDPQLDTWGGGLEVLLDHFYLFHKGDGKLYFFQLSIGCILRWLGKDMQKEFKSGKRKWKVGKTEVKSRENEKKILLAEKSQENEKSRKRKTISFNKMQ